MDGKRSGILPLIVVCAGLSGCASPYHADQGALFGGLAGAGVGALVGEAVGNPLAGAAIGAGVGTLSGAAVGSSLDEIEARNRFAIESRLGRPVAAGAVTPEEIVAMTQAGVGPDIIVNHVRIHGTARLLETQDLIYLQNSGVSSQVIQAMQAPPAAPAMAVREPLPAPAPIIVQEHYYADPWPPFGPPRHHWRHHRHWHHRHHHRHHDPGVSWGLSFSTGH